MIRGVRTFCRLLPRVPRAAVLPGAVLLSLVLLTCDPFDPFYRYEPPGPDPVTWQKTIGGAGEDEAVSVVQAPDGGYALIGYTNSYSSGGDFDAWLVKTDAQGEIEWSKTFGGAGKDQARRGIAAPGGGYVLTGVTQAEGSDHTDVFLVKTKADGTLDWEKTYPTSDSAGGWCVACTSDGGYVIAGCVEANALDVIVIRTDADGNPVGSTWQYGSAGFEQPEWIRQAADGGYIITGTAQGSQGDEELYLLRIAADGSQVWSQPRTFGVGSLPDRGMAVEPTADGDFLVAGWTSYGPGDLNGWLIKVSSEGTHQWDRTFGGGADDRTEAIHPVSDGGFVLAGTTKSFEGWYQAWLVRTDSAGDVSWHKRFGGDGDEWAHAVDVTADGGFVLAGCTTAAQGSDKDAYLVYYKP